MNIKWLAGMSVKAPEFMARFHDGGVVKTPPLPGPIRGAGVAGIWVDEYTVMADSRNWIPVYLEGEDQAPVGRLYTNADRWSNQKRMAVTVEDQTSGKSKLINLDFKSLSRVYDGIQLDGKQLAVVQKILDDDWVPTWADKIKEENLYRYRFRWNVLQVSQADWHDFFDFPTFEPI